MDGLAHQGFAVRNWRRRALIVLAIFCGLILIFHRPLLFGVGYRIALRQAAKENLRLQFQIEGNIFTNLTIRNLHAVPIGPSDVESIDIDLVRLEYGFFSLLHRGILTGIRNANVRTARIVLNPSKKRLEPSPPNPKKRIELPPLFPEAVHVADATIVVRNQPHDFVAEHVTVDLDPRRVGEIKIKKLQLVGGQTWSDLLAQATYADRNLMVSNVKLANDEWLRAINVDASHIDARKLAINFEYYAQEGRITGSLLLREAQGSLDTAIQVRGDDTPIAALNKFIALPENWMRGELEKVDVDLGGLLSSPATWNGKIAAEVRDFRQQSSGFDHARFEIIGNKGVAMIETADVTQGQNQFHLRGSAQLPRDIHDLARLPASFEVTGILPDLRPATASMGQQLSGSAQVRGKIDIKNAKLMMSLSVSAEAVGFAEGKMDTLNANVTATKLLKRKAADAAASTVREPWFADVRSTAEFNGSNIRYRDYAIDSAEGSVDVVDDLLTVQRLNVSRRQNNLSMRGSYHLPQDLRLATAQDMQVDIALSAPQLGDFWINDSPNKVSGPLQASAEVERKHGVANGGLTVFASNVTTRDLVVKQLSAQCPIWNNAVYVNDFTAALNERDFVAANGIVDLAAPHRYSGKFNANVSNLSTLEPLLRTVGNQNELAGSLVVDWEGSGEAATFKHNGKLNFRLDDGRYGNTQSLRAYANATYTPDGMDVPTIFVASSKMDFQAIAQAKGDTLEISKIQFDQGEAKYASGYISIPFVWKNLGTSRPVLAANGKVFATFQSENVDIKKVFEELGMTPPVSGTMTVKLDARGTLADLNARLDLQMRDLRGARLPKLEPATFELTAESQRNQLSVAGKLQQAKIQSVELTANLPFNLETIARERGLPDATPLSAKVRLPRSSVNFVRQFVPAVQELDGDVALDVDVTGTIAQPVLSGSGDMTVNVARASNATLPALRDFKARLNFARDALTLEQFGGELSGGRFTMSGRVTFPKLTAANLDLQLKSDAALIARNDTLTARADADIKIAGPLNSANVTGTVSMTNSHVLKNLDLIPIGLPGRPAPQPPAARPEFSFPDPPVRDWKLDVAIKTRDPVLIRGSMANGGAVSDLHLGGTGLRPTLDGVVRLENVEATLPFSRLEVSSGSVYFSPDDSFNPRLDLHGTSVIHDHTIHVYVYGTALQPEAVFTSEPPLPQEEIISLLATGTTREELTGSNNVLASRAAMLLGQQLYRKIFKKGEPTQTNSVFDRLDVDVGTVDPRTGQQQATARFKINDQFVFVGDIGVGGDYRGMLKYLIRFR
ncbi:MAG TPA: translocation/assembly module TamB domain-containing protein [Chthoniobacterales bacterium]